MNTLVLAFLTATVMAIAVSAEGTEFSLRFAAEQVKNVCNKKCIKQYNYMKDEEDSWTRYCDAFEGYADCLENDDPCAGSSDKISDVRRRCRKGPSSSASDSKAPELDIRVAVGALRGKCLGRCNNEFNIVDAAADNKKEYCSAFIDYSNCLLHDSACYKAKQSDVDWIIRHCNSGSVLQVSFFLVLLATLINLM